jgi:hypothetical protein
MTDQPEDETPDVTARPVEEHTTDAAKLESRDRAQPTLLGDRANLRADDPDPQDAVEHGREQREALLDRLAQDREG